MAPLAALILIAAAAFGQNRNVAATSKTEWTTLNPFTQLTAATFAQPPDADRPWVRMNMPATADPAEIKAELQDMHDKGMAGVEIGQAPFRVECGPLPAVTRA